MKITYSEKQEYKPGLYVSRADDDTYVYIIIHINKEYKGYGIKLGEKCENTMVRMKDLTRYNGSVTLSNEEL